MMTTASEHKIDKVEKMAGGKGHVIIEHLLGEAELDGKCGLYAKVTIEPGCTLGFHEHHGETETYYILSGEGSYNDGEKSFPVKTGDVTFCPDNSGHALDNTGGHRPRVHGADHQEINKVKRKGRFLKTESVLFICRKNAVFRPS